MLKMTECVRKFTTGRDLLTDFRTDTCLRAKACMLLSQHRKSVEYDSDSGFLSAAEPDHLLTSAEIDFRWYGG